MPGFFFPLVNNAALLLSLALVFDMTVRSGGRISRIPVLLLTGVVTAVSGMAVMMSPLRYVDGVIFDTRSILLGISGLFFGPVPTLIAVTATIAVRLAIGGPGALMGILVIFTTGGIGCLWGRIRKGRIEDISIRELYAFGLVIHLVMIGLMFTLPGDASGRVLTHIAPAVILLYPFGTILLGLILVNRLRRIRSRQELEEREEDLHITLQSIGDAVISVGLDGKILRMNPAAEALTGWTFSEARGSGLDAVFRIVDAGTRNPETSPVKTVLETGSMSGLTDSTILIAKDGSERRISDSAAPVKDSEGVVVGVVLVFRDITAAYERDRALKESDARYRSLFENSHTVILIVDPETGAIVDANDAAVSFYGWDRETLRSMNIRYNSERNEQELKAAMQKIISGECNHYVSRHKLADGSERDIDVFTGPIGIGGKVYLYTIIHDITERRQTESALRRSLEEREVLLRELYHRTKNNMQVIVSMLSLKRRQFRNTELGEIIADLETKIGSMALVHQRLYMSKNLSFIGLDEYLGELADMVRTSFGTRADPVELAYELEETTVPLDAAVPLGLAVNELLTNAFKYAFPDGRKGKIRIELRHEGNRTLLTVSDDGVGMPRSAGDGDTATMGIAMVKAIVENQLGGSVLLESGNRGTAWTIAFETSRYHERL